jgi:hypothetical protein
MLKTKEEIIEWLNKYGVEDYTVNEDLTVNVDGYVDLSFKKLKSIDIQFNKVSADFFCIYNELTSLKGCPQIVGGNFSCHSNSLTSLKGSPKEVGGSFDCSNNQLTSLDGCPKEVGGWFHCRNNSKLNNLENIIDFKEIKKILTINNNKLTIEYNNVKNKFKKFKI